MVHSSIMTYGLKGLMRKKVCVLYNTCQNCLHRHSGENVKPESPLDGRKGSDSIQIKADALFRRFNILFFAGPDEIQSKLINLNLFLNQFDSCTKSECQDIEITLYVYLYLNSDNVIQL